MECGAGLLLSIGVEIFFELWVLRMGDPSRAGAGRSSQVIGTGRTGKQGVCEAGFGGCLLWLCQLRHCEWCSSWGQFPDGAARSCFAQQGL